MLVFRGERDLFLGDKERLVGFSFSIGTGERDFVIMGDFERERRFGEGTFFVGDFDRERERGFLMGDGERFLLLSGEGDLEEPDSDPEKLDEEEEEE